MFVSVLRLVQGGLDGNEDSATAAYTLVYKLSKISKMLENIGKRHARRLTFAFDHKKGRKANIRRHMKRRRTAG